MSDSDKKIELIRKAFELKSQKKYDDAIEYMKNALSINVNTHENTEIYSQIGEIYLSMKNLDLALAEFQKALSIDNAHKHSKQKCFDIYFEKGQYQKALHLAQKICENDKNATSYYNYLKVLYKLEKFQDIIEIFNSLDEEIKLNPDILYLLSLTDKEKQEELLNKIIEIDDSNQEANLDLARIAFKKGDYKKVIQCCINLDENNPEVAYFIGVIESKKKNSNRAIEYLINAIKLDNNKNDYYFELAKVYMDSTRFSEAFECLNQSIKYSLINNDKKNLDEKYFLTGWLLYKRQEFQNALLNLNLVEKNSKFYTDSSILIQAINMQDNNLADAKENLEKIYEKQSNNTILLDTLADVYKKLKMPKKAIEIYKKALILHPDSLFYKMELVDLYIDTNMYSSAMVQIEQVKQKTKKCASIYNSLARIYYRLKDYNSAIESLNEYLKLDKNNSESYYFKGLILNDLKKFKEAKTSIYSAISLKPDCAKYYFQMARSYFELEQYEDALLYSKEAIELDQNDINYKRQGYEIAQKIGDKNLVLLYEKQLKRSEKIIKNI